MANFELRFFCSSNKEDYIKIEKGLNNDLVLVSRINNHIGLINMDKSTAIKFAKTLRTEINKITESEVNNG
jgi:pectin methylesterase-like acyl-CoA thioesterase